MKKFFFLISLLFVSCPLQAMKPGSQGPIKEITKALFLNPNDQRIAQVWKQKIDIPFETIQPIVCAIINSNSDWLGSLFLNHTILSYNSYVSFLETCLEELGKIKKLKNQKQIALLINVEISMHREEECDGDSE